MKCHCQAEHKHKARMWTGRLRQLMTWSVPAALLVLIPKCPACLIAHVALWTGLGLSVSCAVYLRQTLLLLGVSLLILLTIRFLGRAARQISPSFPSFRENE